MNTNIFILSLVRLLFLNCVIGVVAASLSWVLFNLLPWHVAYGTLMTYGIIFGVLSAAEDTLKNFKRKS